MKHKFLFSMGATLFFIIFISCSQSCIADRGMMPVDGTVNIYEPGQKAIIGWNGTEEVLILATDVYSDASTSVLEVIPLPSAPEIELGDIESFKVINRLIYQYSYENSMGIKREGGNDSSGIEVVFHEKLGSHNLMVIKVNDFSDFEDWVDDFRTDNNLDNEIIPPKMEQLISNYLLYDIDYFAFDIIEVNENKKSVEPIIYKFSVDYLYYPLQISSIVNGDTEIFLFTLTDPDFNDTQIIDLGFERKIEFNVTSEDLTEINKDIGGLFRNKAHLSSFKFSGSLQTFDDDIMVGYVPKPVQNILDDEDDGNKPERSINIITWIVNISTIIVIIVCILVIYTKERKYRRSTLEPLVIEHLNDNPGDYFSNIKRNLNTSTGNLSYIINKLEREQVIKSRQFGQKRRFFPYDYPVKENFFLTKLQFNVLDMIRKAPGLPQKDVAYLCGLSSRNFNYHAKILLKNGYIFVVSDGKMKRYYPTE